MPLIYAPQAAVTNDSGAATLGFQGAPNVLYDRTMVGDTVYTISTAGATGGETLRLTLRGPHAYSFESSVPINWGDSSPPTPGCSATAFDRVIFEILQDGSLLGVAEALSAYAPLTLTPLTAIHGEAWSGSLGGLEPSAVLYIESSDDTAITVTPTSSTTANLSGSFAYAGAPIIAVQQKPSGGATTTNTFTMTVS